MASSKIRRFEVLGIRAGIAAVRKRCGWCNRRHITRFPADDLLVARRHATFCDRCDASVEEALAKYPRLRRRKR